MAAFSRMARPRNVALAAVLAANGVLAQNSCVYLQGVTDDGTELNYLQVSSGGTDTYTAGFVDDVTQATSLNIDPTTGKMLDFTDGGRIANIDAGFDFDYLFFDYQAEMDQFDQLAVSCTTETQTETDGDITILNCAAADNAAVNVFNYCDGVVALSNSVQPDFGCVGLTLVVQDAGVCPELPATTSTTSTTSSTSTADAGATSTTTDAGVTTTSISTTTATDTTTATTTTSSGSSTSTGNTSILADPNTLSSSTTAVINGTTTVLPVDQSTTTAALTTSTIFATQTVTVSQDGGAVSTSMSVYPLYTTVCPIGAPAPTGGHAAGGYGAGAGAGAGGYGGNAGGAGGYGASPSAPVYNPAHLVALPATICASQLNAVASKYPAGAMNSYSNYGVTPVNVGANTGAGGNTAVTGNGNTGYGAGNGAVNGAGNNAGNNAYGAGNNAAGAGNNAGAGNMAGAGAGAGAGGKGANAIGAAANNGSAAMGGAAASGTGAYKANPTAPMQYEGSASSVKMALGGVFAAAIALVCLI